MLLKGGLEETATFGANVMLSYQSVRYNDDTVVIKNARLVCWPCRNGRQREYVEVSNMHKEVGPLVLLSCL